MSRSTPVRRGMLAALASLAVVTALLMAPPAESADTGWISGTMVSETGAPLPPGARATIWRRLGSIWQPSSQVVAGADGSYRLRALPAGTYRIQFAAPGYAGEFWDDAVTVNAATDVVLGASGSVRGVDATLTRAAYVEGRVVDERTGQAADRAEVEAWRVDPGSAEPWFAGVAGTDSSGRYRLEDLPGGAYRFHVTDLLGRLDGEWFDDQDTFATADPVLVGPGQSVTLGEVALRRLAEISGTVTGQDGGPLPGVVVTAHVWSPVTHSWGVWTDATTDADGAYTLAGLRVGTYRLGFDAPFPHLDEFYDDAATLSTGRSVAVTDRHQLVAGLDVELARAAACRVTRLVRPQVVGEPVVGRRLGLTHGRWSPADVTLTYRWSSDGVRLPGATGPVLRLTPALVGSSVRARVAAASAGCEPLVVRTPPVIVHSAAPAVDIFVTRS